MPQSLELGLPRDVLIEPGELEDIALRSSNGICSSNAEARRRTRKDAR